MSWTFIIQKSRNDLRFIPIIIESIEKQNIPNYEILFADEDEDTFKENVRNKIKIIYTDPTFQKNEIAKYAKYDNLCFLQDYIMLSDNWYEGFEQLGYDWNISSTKIISVYNNLKTKLNFCFKRIYFLENIDNNFSNEDKHKTNKISSVNCLS